MKTLILNGSPRKSGDTASLVSIITQKITGNYRIVDAYRCNISPCLDCRYCRQNDGCIIQDEMQEIYEFIQECDNILIASPLYFSELTGKLLDVGSRLYARLSRDDERIGESVSIENQDVICKGDILPKVLPPRLASSDEKSDCVSVRQ